MGKCDGQVHFLKLLFFLLVRGRGLSHCMESMEGMDDISSINDMKGIGRGVGHERYKRHGRQRREDNDTKDNGMEDNWNEDPQSPCIFFQLFVGIIVEKWN